MKNRFAFTMIELVFVIVIMGIIGKFGLEFLAKAYQSFIYEKVNHQLQSQSEMAVEFISSKLQYRIKDSVIARQADGTFVAIGSSDLNESYTILEWVGSDSDGFRGTTKPYWSGIIDLDSSSISVLKSPETNTSHEDSLISILSSGNSHFDDAAIYFIGSNSDVTTGYGWDGTTATDQNTTTMHPIRKSTNNGEEELLIPINASTGADNNFTGVNVYEYYKLSWTAYAIEHNTTSDKLILYYDYQPWQGESYTSGKKTTIMENVSTFKFMSIGSIMKIQVCTKSDILQNDGGDYSLCKEKTIL